MYILDTNIIIYYLQGNVKVTEFLSDLCQPSFAISTITRLEVLLGSNKESRSIAELEEILDDCKNISVDTGISKEVVKLALLQGKKLKFKDLIIAATAKVNKFTLITNDKDFKNINGLKMEYLKP